MPDTAVRPTRFGRYAVAEAFRAERFTLYRGEKLTTVDHEPPIPVLDQEDLLAQGIHTSQLIPGAPDVDALGSCTCNPGTASYAERATAAGRGLPFATSDAIAAERWAIVLYHNTTDQTGEP